MANQTIDVTFENRELKISSDTATLVAPGENEPMPSVTWRFKDEAATLIESGYTPGLRFVGSFKGPFESICQTPEHMIGNGNSGKMGLYEYRAILSSPDRSDVIRSKLASVTNTIDHNGLETAPYIEVRIRKDGDSHVVDVKPDAINRAAGQVVVWNVINEVSEESEWYPRVVFDDPPKDAHQNFGPFTSWQSNGLNLIGAGSSGVPGRYKYHFELLSLSGEVLTFYGSPDPTVDDEGEPPG